MNIAIDVLEQLITKHVFKLSEKELMALAFVLDIKISEFEKTKHCITFKMGHRKSYVIVRCYENSNMSIGRSAAVKSGISGLTSWGGCFSFASAVSIMRNFFSNGYELIIKSEEKLKYYSEIELKSIIEKANHLVEIA